MPLECLPLSLAGLSVHSSLDRCPDVLSSVISSRLLPRPSLCPALYPTCLYLASFLVVKAIKAGKNQFRLSPRKKEKASLIIQSKASISHTHTHMHTHARSSNLLLLAVSTTSHLINNLGNGSWPCLPGRLQWWREPPCPTTGVWISAYPHYDFDQSLNFPTSQFPNLGNGIRIVLISWGALGLSKLIDRNFMSALCTSSLPEDADTWGNFSLEPLTLVQGKGSAASCYW